jgi:beta-glucanase (GH16 family)
MAPLLLTILLGTETALADPPADTQWVPIPELTDEFKGSELDWNKWTNFNPKWLGRQPALFAARNVAVADGELRLTAKLEDVPHYHSKGYNTYTTAAVKSRVKVLYGYFEVRAKPMKSAASSAFWFYDDTPELWTEIDVFEVGGGVPSFERAYIMGTHVFRMPGYQGTAQHHLADGSTWQAPYALADEYHVYGLEWDEKEIKWYVDGNVVWTKGNRHWHQPIYMNFDSELYVGRWGLPNNADLPSTFAIDYVRSWTKAGQTVAAVYPESVAAPAVSTRYKNPQQARGFLAIAGAIFFMLGLFHGAVALWALIKRPAPIAQGPSPDSSALAARRTWIGFNLSQCLSLILFGGAVVAIANKYIFMYVLVPGFPGILLAVSAAYIALSLILRIRTSAIGSSLALLCILGADLLS